MIEFQLQRQLISANGPMQLNVQLTIAKGEFITFFGPSGAGKTSLLRMLAGLFTADNGYLKVDGEEWYNSNSKICLPPQKRSVGFMFQNYALFPHMTVRGNLEYASPVKKDQTLINHLLEISGLIELQKRYPNDLSGGQQQRIALIRALIRRPKLLLLDEPLSALDTKTRTELQEKILELHREFATTTILVSHDLPEVFKLSDRVLVLEEGQVVQMGTPEQVFIRDKISGKFRFSGEVIEIKREEMIYILTILIGNNAVKVVAGEDDIEDLKIGDSVIIFSKSFNPIILKK